MRYAISLRAMAVQAVNGKIIIIFKEMYEAAQTYIKTYVQGKLFRIERGVRTGRSLISKPLCTWTNNDGFKVGKRGKSIDGEYLSHLRFADNDILISNDLKEIVKNAKKNS